MKNTYEKLYNSMNAANAAIAKTERDIAFANAFAISSIVSLIITMTIIFAKINKRLKDSK